MSRRRRKHHKEGNDIDVTPLLNVMVVLVAFLLASAVYVHTAILQLTLPTGGGPSSNPDENKKPLILEVIIYKNRFEVTDRQTGPLKFIPFLDGKYDFNTLSFYLQVIKNRFPDIKEVSILLEKDTPYDLLIQTMDTVRAKYDVVKGERVEYELFPEISIGDAPPDQVGTEQPVPQTTAPAAGG
ncbi:MAG TPA: biopolymer transporter ExbD [Dongiaceae bacterium]|nr:biopolymer transporter ExbD [Dongiaceae bacterium]